MFKENFNGENEDHDVPAYRAGNVGNGRMRILRLFGRIDGYLVRKRSRSPALDFGPRVRSCIVAFLSGLPRHRM